MVSRFHILPTLLAAVLSAAVLSCSDSASPLARSTASNQPTTPIVPAKPIITVSSDSLAATAVAGASVIESTVSIGAGDTTKVRGLSANVSGDADAASWLATAFDSTTAPAKLTVRLDPRTASVGVHTATISVGATGADPKVVRAQLTVRARPVLLVDSAARQLSASIGDAVAPVTLAVRSSSDTITKLTLGTPDCDTRAWMTAKLSADATPAVATLSFDVSGLAAGTHSCRVDVRSAQSLVDSATRTIVVSLTLRATPRIALDQTAITQNAQAGDPAPATSVLVTNAGSGTLDGLTLDPVDYGTGPSGWLTATLDSSVAPTAIRIAASAKTLAAGNYSATVTVRSSAAGVANNSASFTVTLGVGPRPFQFKISPTAISISYSMSTGTSVTGAVGLLDGNNSGTSATIKYLGPTTGPSSPNCPMISFSGPIMTTPVIPQTNVFQVSPYGPKVVMTCSTSWIVQLTNGQSGTFTVTASMLP